MGSSELATTPADEYGDTPHGAAAIHVFDMMIQQKHSEKPSQAEAAFRPGPQLSIIVPTFNERENVPELINRLDRALTGICWEVVFVDDDSPDETYAVASAFAQRDARVRCIHRLDRRGLSSACIEGFLSSSAPLFAVMDGDLQHDEQILAKMLRELQEENLDVVIGSRYVEGGGVGDWNISRSRASRFATRLAAIVCKYPVADPMSGFFLIRRDVFTEAMRRLSGVGFKILLDLLASSPRRLKLRELPYEFRERMGGESKFDIRAIWDYLQLLAEKSIGRFVPMRFLIFGSVGALGVLVHMSVLTALYKGFATAFKPAQIAATLVAMVFNYALNNAVTYRDRQRRGLNWWTGLLGFVGLCSLGAVANVGVAAFLFQESGAAWAISGLAGVLIGAVWNYAATARYTWADGRRR